MMGRNYLAALLMSYDMDAPHHGKWESGHYPQIDVGDIKTYINQPHEGDCTHVPAPCIRCHAEACLHQADWLLMKFESEDDEGL